MDSENSLFLKSISEYFKGSLCANLFFYEKIDSTNKAARLYAEGKAFQLPDGKVIKTPSRFPAFFVAAEQTLGRGRLGRSFLSDAGRGLYMTYVFSPEATPDKAPLITAAAAVRLCHVIENMTGAKTFIKWVNDIFLGERKAAGILTEGSLSDDLKKLKYAAVGIGINLYKKPLPESLINIATDIESYTGKRVDKAELFIKLSEALLSISPSDTSFLDDYRRRCFILGKRITVHTGEESFPAVAVAINDDATLTVKLPDGSTRVLCSGEVSIRI